MQGHGKKFGAVEIVIGTLICIIVDIVAFFADGAALVGGWVVQALSWLIFVFWFHFKGVQNETQMSKILVRFAVQAVPVIPTYTATFLFVVYQANNPKIGAIAQVAAAKKPNLKAPPKVTSLTV